MLKNKIIALLIILLLILSFTFAFHKPNISTATYNELLDIHGIGEVRLQLIGDYINTHRNVKSEDLRAIEGIDDMIIEQLER